MKIEVYHFVVSHVIYTNEVKDNRLSAHNLDFKPQARYQFIVCQRKRMAGNRRGDVGESQIEMDGRP